MKSQIASQLEKIEKENDVTILYACESGSRAWGFDNIESDYDVRFIYKRNNLKDYLSLSDKKDVIESMDNDLDIVGWDIKKALLLHYKSNPNLREWTISPITYVDFKTDIFRGLPDFDGAVLKFHYANIASNNWRRLSKIVLNLTKRDFKMYLYNCRCILTWMVLDEGNDPSINIFELLKQVNGLDDGIRDDILELIAYYKNSCQGNLDSKILNSINSWMDYHISLMMGDFPKKDDNRNFNDYDDRFFEIVTQNSRIGSNDL